MEKPLSSEEVAKIQKEQGDAQDVFDEQVRPRYAELLEEQNNKASKNESVHDTLDAPGTFEDVRKIERGETVEEKPESPKDKELASLNEERNKLADLTERNEKLREEVENSLKELRELRESKAFSPNNEITARQRALEDAEKRLVKESVYIVKLERQYLEVREKAVDKFIEKTVQHATEDSKFGEAKNGELAKKLLASKIEYTMTHSHEVKRYIEKGSKMHLKLGWDINTAAVENPGKEKLLYITSMEVKISGTTGNRNEVNEGDLLNSNEKKTIEEAEDEARLKRQR